VSKQKTDVLGVGESGPTLHRMALWKHALAQQSTFFGASQGRKEPHFPWDYHVNMCMIIGIVKQSNSTYNVTVQDLITQPVSVDREENLIYYKPLLACHTSVYKISWNQQYKIYRVKPIVLRGVKSLQLPFHSEGLYHYGDRNTFESIHYYQRTNDYEVPVPVRVTITSNSSILKKSAVPPTDVNMRHNLIAPM
jgi:hypothetical protein